MKPSHSTPKSRLVITDTDVVIDLHELDIWDLFIRQNDVYVTRTVVQESKRYRKPVDSTSKLLEIDLESLSSDGRITILDLNATDLIPLAEEAERLGVNEKIDLGETETIAAAYSLRDDLTVCLKDGAAIRFATLIGLSDRCISVEEALNSSGLGRKVHPSLSTDRFKAIVNGAKTERVQLLLALKKR